MRMRRVQRAPVAAATPATIRVCRSRYADAPPAARGSTPVGDAALWFAASAREVESAVQSVAQSARSAICLIFAACHAAAALMRTCPLIDDCRHAARRRCPLICCQRCSVPSFSRPLIPAACRLRLIRANKENPKIAPTDSMSRSLRGRTCVHVIRVRRERTIVVFSADNTTQRLLRALMRQDMRRP